MDESGLIGIHNPVGLGDVHKPLDVVQKPCNVVHKPLDVQKPCDVVQKPCDIVHKPTDEFPIALCFNVAEGGPVQR